MLVPPQLVSQAEANDVKGAQRTAGFHGKEGDPQLPQAGRQIRAWQVGAVTQLIRLSVEDVVEDEVA
jgi:hypothetical protein